MTDFPLRPPLVPMEAKVSEELPPAGTWAYEPKWDGFRILAWSHPDIRLDSRNGRPLLRYFPELQPALQAVPAGTVVDGEVVVVRAGKLDFDGLSERIHPAETRIEKLARETPAELVAFDLLALHGRDLRSQPFQLRRQELEQLLADLSHPWHLTPSTTDPQVAERWFWQFESAGCDGIVAKRRDEPYVEGKREMVKVKHRRTVDCVVGGYRLHKDGPQAGVGSLLLGLYDQQGRLHFIGHCSSFSDDERVELYRRLQSLRVDGHDPFGEDVRRPGEPSRWTGNKDLSWVALRPELVCEVSYGQLTNQRFRHATRFERWRPDKDARACKLDQLERPEGPDFAEVVAS